MKKLPTDTQIALTRLCAEKRSLIMTLRCESIRKNTKGSEELIKMLEAQIEDHESVIDLIDMNIEVSEIIKNIENEQGK